MTQKIIAGSKYDRKMSGTVLRKDIQVGFERKLFVKFGVIVGFLTSLVQRWQLNRGNCLGGKLSLFKGMINEPFKKIQKNIIKLKKRGQNIIYLLGF